MYCEYEILNLAFNKTYEDIFSLKDHFFTRTFSIEKVFLEKPFHMDYGLAIDINEENMEYYNNKELGIFYRRYGRIYYLKMFNKNFIVVLDKKDMDSISRTALRTCRCLDCESSFEEVKYALAIAESEITYPFVINTDVLTFKEKESLLLMTYFFYSYYINPENYKQHIEETKQYLKGKHLDEGYEYNPATGEYEFKLIWVEDKDESEEDESEEDEEYYY